MTTDSRTCFQNTRGEATSLLDDPLPKGREVVFSGDWPLSNRQIQKVLADFKESPLADDVVPAQLEGFGADNFLVLNEKKAQRSFRIVAEFKAASGSFRTRAYMANAINTWPKLAEEVLELRKRLSEIGEG